MNPLELAQCPTQWTPNKHTCIITIITTAIDKETKDQNFWEISIRRTHNES